MSKVEQQTISSLKQIRIDLDLLQPDDPQALIQIGAGLEAVAVNLPEEYISTRELLGQCLETLQAMFHGKADDFSQTVRLIAVALLAVEQSIVSTPNSITEAVINKAKELLENGITSEEIENIDQTDEFFDNVKDAVSDLSTLDAVANWLIQIEPEDQADVIRLCDALKKLSSETNESAVKKLLTKAARETDKIIKGKTGDVRETLTLIGDLIGQASPSDTTEEFAEQTTNPVEKSNVTQISQVKTLIKEPVEAEESAVAIESYQTEYEADVLTEDADISLLMEFVIESHENIEAAESAFLLLENEPDNLENINTVFRAFHTVKGSAAFLGLKRLTELAHHAESLLSRIRDGEIRCMGGYANLALRAIDMLKEMFVSLQDALEGGEMVLPLGYGELLHILMNPEAAGISGKADNSPETSEFIKTPESSDNFSEQNLVSTKIGDILVEMDSITPEDVEEALHIQKDLRSGTKQPQHTESSVRVRTDRLDRLINMVGELVVAQSMLAQDETLSQSIHFEIARKVAHAGKIVRDLQDLSMAMRMIPLKNTFSKMARVVRDVAQKCGKVVEFVNDGEDTEIDRNMVDLIADPLVHMVRNAVDHGIEFPDEREKSGKNRSGKVRLSAYHSGGNVVVELADDGNGLDAKKILQKALEKGLIESDKGLTDHQIFNLIFAPGMSTNDTVTDVSGRGVGMDVVRRNIESMHGRIEISSEKGKGSLFTIRLPLTLAITDGMLVRVGTERYIVPTVHIYLSFRPNSSAITTVAGKGEMVQLRGELMPIVRLHSLFEIEGAVENPIEGSLVIVADEKRRCALLVDDLLGQYQVVAKALGSGVGKVPGVAGGAILGDGCVGLILDTAELVAMARQTTTRSFRKERPLKKVA